MTVFTEYLAAVRAYENELRTSKPADELASEAEALFDRLVLARVQKGTPAATAASLNSQLRRG